MKKYIIGAVPRTGSTLYANLLDACYTYTNLNDISGVCFTSVAGLPDWSKPFHHTHQVEVFKNAPNDYVKLLPTRSLLDSTISVMIASYTSVWHIINNDDAIAYQNSYKDAGISINIDQFKDQVRSSSSLYAKKFRIFEQWPGEKYLLEYNTHAENYAEFYSTLGINFTPPSNWIDFKMSVNKFTMIENLQQVLDAYKSIDVKYNFNDDVTITHIENILKERQ